MSDEGTIGQAVRGYAQARLLLARDAAQARITEALGRRAQQLQARRRKYEPKRPISGAAAMMRLMEKRRDPYADYDELPDWFA
jgi:hypothetical protein